MRITAISILVTVVLIGGAIMLVGSRKDSDGTTPQDANNVSVTDGKQIIEISAKGGYSPKMTVAEAGIPTVIKINTLGTFDCSAALVIPSLGYRNNLPPSGETLVELPPQESGSTLQGLCAMGMYNFQIQFK
ncbi:MAG: cupredoxin domain-containing protein [bacterium]|nr:cupredoxin domain-containing protein [bacterium]